MATVDFYTVAGADAADDAGGGGLSDAALLARANHTGTQTADTVTDGTTNKAYTAAEKTKLGAVSTTAWTSYTPTITAGGTHGNAVGTGGYTQTGKTVHFWAKVVVGSTTSISTGPLTVALPVTARTAGSYAAMTGTITDTGVAYHFAIASLATTTTALLNVLSATRTLLDVSATVPMTWATNDVIEVHGTYEAA